MSHKKEVDGEILLCWGRLGDPYKRYRVRWEDYEFDTWFEALGNAVEGSWRSENPVEIQEVMYKRDYGVDKRVDTVKTWLVTCDDKFNVKVEERN